MGLIDDNWALAPAGVVGAERTLELLQGLPLGAAKPVWQEELSVLKSLDGFYQPGPARDRLRRFECAVLRQIQAQASDQNLRQNLQRALAGYDDPAAAAAAQADLTRLLGGQTLTPDERSVALDAGVAHADAALYDRVLAAARAPASTEDRTRLLYALSGVQDEALATRTLELTLGDDVASGVAVEMLLHLARLHGPMVEAFIQSHAEAYGHKLRPIDQAELKTVAKRHEDTVAQQKMKAGIDAWLAAHHA